MLRDADTVLGYTLRATDGDIGKITNLYFHDEDWSVRYLVVRTGSWLEDRRLLVSPAAIRSVDAAAEALESSLTRADIEAGRPATFDASESERVEMAHFWPHPEEVEQPLEPPANLRSIEEVEGYKVGATDGDIGHVAGFVLDDSDWVIRYLVVDTRTLWPGKHVLMSPEWVQEVKWDEARVQVDLSQDAIKDSPEFDPDSPVTREYEADLCHFYNREGYWNRPCADDEVV